MCPSSEHISQGIEQPAVSESAYQRASDFVYKLTAGVYIYKPEYALYGNCTPFVLDELKIHIPVLIEKAQIEGDKGAWSDVLTFLEYTYSNWRGREWQDAREVVVGDMAKILPHLQELYCTGDEQDNPRYYQYLFQIRDLVGEYDTETEQSESLISSVQEILHQEKDTFFQYLQSIENIQYADNPDEALDSAQVTFALIAAYIAYASSEDAADVESRAEGVFDALKSGKTDYIAELVYLNSQKTYTIADRYIHNILASAGIANHMDTFWRDIRAARLYGFEKVERLAPLLCAIEELAKEGADIPQFLHDTFGIVRFDRYTLQTLLEMYQDAKNPSQEPYVLAVYPKSDWNNAFVQKNISIKKQSNLSTLGYKIRIIEAGNLEELILRGVQVKKLFGQASGIIFGGHGTGSTIQLDTNVYLSAKDFQTRGGRILKKGLSRLLRPGSTIVLHSCRAGVLGGIAQQISTEYSANTIGVNAETTITHISGSINNDRLIMNVRFEEGFPRTYMNGILQQKKRRST